MEKVLGWLTQYFIVQFSIDSALKLAYALPTSKINEENIWRKQDIRNAQPLAKNAMLARKHYPEGKVSLNRRLLMMPTICPIIRLSKEKSGASNERINFCRHISKQKVYTPPKLKRIRFRFSDTLYILKFSYG